MSPEQLPDTILWHSQHLQKHIKMKEQVCLAARERGSRQPLPTLHVWAGTASQDCAEPQGEQPEVQRKLQERSKPTGLCLLPCTPDPQNRVKPTPYQAGRGPRPPGLYMEHRDTSCRRALPDTLNTGRDHT